MNEHIKQLAKQAGLVQNGDWGMKRWEGPRSDSINDQDLAKFAHMIVAECISMADKESERYSNLDQEYCSMAMDNYRELVRKHFGVEE